MKKLPNQQRLVSEQLREKLTAEKAPGNEITARGLVTVKKASKFLSISRGSIYGLMTAGILPSVKIGRSRRIPRAAVLELARKSLVVAD
jgi:excisionase family DNA binding protein